MTPDSQKKLSNKKDGALDCNEQLGSSTHFHQHPSIANNAIGGELDEILKWAIIQAKIEEAA